MAQASCLHVSPMRVLQQGMQAGCLRTQGAMEKRVNNTSQSIAEIEDRFQIPTYKKFPFALERGEDVWVFTLDGERYLDLYGGHAVVSTGHCHPRVVAAIKAQAEKLIFYSNLVYSDVRARAAEKLISIAPAGFTKSFFVNSGADANEAAVKLARELTGKQSI